MVSLHRFNSRQRVAIRLGAALIVLLSLAGFITMRTVEGELRDRVDAQLEEDASEVIAVLEVLDEDQLAQIEEAFGSSGFDIDRDEWAMYVRRPTCSTCRLPSSAVKRASRSLSTRSAATTTPTAC
jgi:hypothetical protein